MFRFLLMLALAQIISAEEHDATYTSYVGNFSTMPPEVSAVVNTELRIWTAQQGDDGCYACPPGRWMKPEEVHYRVFITDEGDEMQNSWECRWCPLGNAAWTARLMGYTRIGNALPRDTCTLERRGWFGQEWYECKED